LLREESAVNKAIKEKVAEARAFIQAQQKERTLLAEKSVFVRTLLVAEEDPKFPLEQRLSGVVKSAFEFLDFKVEDIDQKIKNAVKKEDFWVTDGNFLAITEVTGTENKNSKVKEFNDILGRMMALYRRQGDLVVPKCADIVGLLVLNYDIGTHPSKRPRAYTGLDAHIVETAVEQNIGILSTVELDKIVMAVRRGIFEQGCGARIAKKAGPNRIDNRQGKLERLRRLREKRVVIFPIKGSWVFVDHDNRAKTQSVVQSVFCFSITFHRLGAIRCSISDWICVLWRIRIPPSPPLPSPECRGCHKVNETAHARIVRREEITTDHVTTTRKVLTLRSLSP